MLTVIRALICLLLGVTLTAAGEPQLVPDVSQRNVEIRYSFTGAELLLFGAIIYPDALSRKRDADIVVVLRGPTNSIIVREKQKIGGIWVNAATMRYRSAPSFYAMASSRPLHDIVGERTAAIYELGVGNLQLSPASNEATGEETDRFERGFIDLLKRASLFQESENGVEITDGALYRAHIRLPARVPVGHYSAETFLIRDGHIIAAAVRDIEISKTGFERFVAVAADKWPWTYGIAAMLISLLSGLGAAALFRRL
ncbi:TIGR02186 family protein [Aquisediminimonas sediminicola]|uniref:TIGR02186 family protein n=1 Tax=Alteraquisediminimonas sediminicola TaxID=2676787 RepID=UPI001C8DADD8|nr:TIGR02186 family protein [Aquisediminimonas sediminicola]